MTIIILYTYQNIHTIYKQVIVLVSLTQLVGTMYKICKVGVQTPATTKKKKTSHSHS